MVRPTVADNNSGYGGAGLIGVLTPQANTTVEPELWSLLPGGWSMLNARLTSDLDTIETRLKHYTTRYHETAMQFGNAPIDALAIACTGTSYLLDKEADQRVVDELQQTMQVPCITAANASVEALHALKVNKLSLLSPYPTSLHKKSLQFWQSRGFDIVESLAPKPAGDAFHPIYAIENQGVYQAYQRLSDSGSDLVLMLGTGMPTLHALLRGAEAGFKPAISTA